MQGDNASFKSSPLHFILRCNDLALAVVLEDAEKLLVAVSSPDSDKANSDVANLTFDSVDVFVFEPTTRALVPALVAALDALLTSTISSMRRWQ
jgi:hypothetical protein